VKPSHVGIFAELSVDVCPICVYVINSILVLIIIRWIT